MIFFIVNSIGETFLGIELGHKEDGSTASAAGYAVLDIVLSGALFFNDCFGLHHAIFILPGRQSYIYYYFHGTLFYFFFSTSF